MQKSHEFHFLMLGNASGTLSDQFLFLLVPTLALLALGFTPSQASLLVAAEWAPRVMFGAIAGKASDGLPRRSVMLVSSLVSLVAVACILVLAALPGQLSFVLLLSACFAYSAGGIFFLVASAAQVPIAVTDRKPEEGIASNSAAQNVARVGGQAFAGPILQVIGPIGAAAVSVFLSALRVVFAFRLPSIVARPKASTSEAGSAWPVLWRHPVLRHITIAALTMNTGGAIVMGAFFSYAYRVLDLSPLWVGVMLFLGGVSAVISATCARKYIARADPVSLCAAAALVTQIAIWLIPVAAYSEPRVTLPVYEIFFSAGATLFAITFSVVQQRSVDNSALARLYGATATLASGAVVFGTLVSAGLMEWLGIFRAVVIGCAVATMGLLSVWKLMWNRRSETRSHKMVNTSATVE